MATDTLPPSIGAITAEANGRQYFAGYDVMIYRAADFPDCTNNGVTVRFNKAKLLRDDVQPHVVERWQAEGYAVLKLSPFEVRGKRDEPAGEYLRAIPMGEKRWCMMGGNFVWSCDSRFRQEVSERPIPVHDRIEG